MVRRLGSILGLIVWGASQVFALGTPKPKPVLEKAAAPEPNSVIARVGDVKLTAAELTEAIGRAFSPDPYRLFAQTDPVDPNRILWRLMGDKALVLEARADGLLNEPTLAKQVERFRTRLLRNALAFTIVPEMPEVTDQEVQDYVASHDKIAPDRARRILSNQKAAQIMEVFYQDLVKRCHYRVHRDAWKRGAEVHERLLRHPVKPRRQPWIQNYQMTEEVSEEERALVLAEWDGGRFTLADWLEALGQRSPPSRPRNLGTVDGFGAFLEQSVRTYVLESEAIRRGLERDPEVVRRLREYEDRLLLNRVIGQTSRTIADPNESQLRRLYREALDTPDLMMRVEVDSIWCRQRADAEKVLAELHGGADFNELQAARSIEDRPRRHWVTPYSEGMFWPVVKAAEPGQVVGPFPGVFRGALAWRLHRVIKSETRKMPTFEKVSSRLGEEYHQRRREALLDQRRAAALDKIPHEILIDDPAILDPRRL